MLQVGDLAPDFRLESDAGATVGLSDYFGCKVVLYFYPQDDTPGCTIEACGFRDLNAEIEGRGAVVLGVSPDTAESHRSFRERYGLNFTLLADPDHSVAEVYGVWGEKKKGGRTYEGILRRTFLIDEEGKVARIFEKVSPEGHGDEVLASL